MTLDELLANLPVIETERLLLRKITLDDAADIFEYASDREVPTYMSWEPHQSIQETYDYLERVMRRYQEHNPGPWAIVHKRDAKMIGTCSYSSWEREDYRAEVGYVLNRRYWGQGYMAEAVRAIVDFGFSRLGMNRIQARCDVPNIGSARVMEKVGMSFEGVLRQQLFEKGTFRDIKIYSILRSEWAEQNGLT
ncbi:MAG TPA: GNAT family protein [Roseiflexaceae bacterium]|nr:GNAT family protein [Roseiflexaceae bacterium]